MCVEMGGSSEIGAAGADLVARTMAPATPPDVVLQLRLAQNLSFSFEQSFYSPWSVKLSKFVLLVKFVPLEGLCYLCFHVPFLLYAFGPVSLRYGSAAAVCQSNDSARPGRT